MFACGVQIGPSRNRNYLVLQWWGAALLIPFSICIYVTFPNDASFTPLISRPQSLFLSLERVIIPLAGGSSSLRGLSLGNFSSGTTFLGSSGTLKTDFTLKNCFSSFRPKKKYIQTTEEWHKHKRFSPSQTSDILRYFKRRQWPPSPLCPSVSVLLTRARQGNADLWKGWCTSCSRRLLLFSYSHKNLFLLGNFHVLFGHLEDNFRINIL